MTSCPRSRARVALGAPRVRDPPGPAAAHQMPGRIRGRPGVAAASRLPTPSAPLHIPAPARHAGSSGPACGRPRLGPSGDIACPRLRVPQTGADWRRLLICACNMSHLLSDSAHAVASRGRHRQRRFRLPVVAARFEYSPAGGEWSSHGSSDSRARPEQPGRRPAPQRSREVGASSPSWRARCTASVRLCASSLV